ncbi:zinc-binding dehydrogenase [Paenarthrobacter sp. NPDC057981]|uniref:zinc-dependent alcohol dehydrogenase n=1 Tax=Paenarthrobacter sp. NPDC057981 TaxID=3346297 RepID=UPI0036DB5C57
MKAVVFTDQGEVIEDRPIPKVLSGEVLVEVAFCGICGSDLHAAHPQFRSGTIMGHEFSGTIVEVASDVDVCKPGDRIVVNPNGRTCGECSACTRGFPNLCAKVWDTSIGLIRNGGLAQYTAVPANVVHVLPEEVDLASAALIEPLSVALRTVRNSGFGIGHEAIVFGGGPIGLLVTALLRAAGASKITVVEPSAARRKLALKQGATAVIDPFSTPVLSVFPDPFSAPSFAFECSGVAELVGEAVAVVRPRGTVTLTGLSRRPATFDTADVLHKEITLKGSFIYVEEFSEAIQLLASGRIDVDSLITGVVSVEDAPEAFAQMRSSQDVIKYLISPSAPAGTAGQGLAGSSVTDAPALSGDPR